MGKNKTMEAGEVVLVNKPTEPQSIAPTTLERQRPKRELSEAQKANLAKLIERNKKKAEERRSVITNNIPEVIPEDKVAVVVKPKRKYVRKAPAWNARDTTPAPPVSPPTPSETEEEESEVEVRPPKHEKKKKPVLKKQPSLARAEIKPRRYETETSDTSEYDGSSSEDEEKVEKYVRKAQKRMEAVQAIENRLKRMSNPYEARNLSIF